MDKNIVLYGVNESIQFIMQLIKIKYHKEVVAVLDRWENENCYQVMHLMSLYYAFGDNDVIINLYPSRLTPLAEFENIGENKQNLSDDFMVV